MSYKSIFPETQKLPISFPLFSILFALYLQPKIIRGDAFSQIQHAKQPRLFCIHIDGKYCLLHLEYFMNRLTPNYSQQILGTSACDICNRMWQIIILCEELTGCLYQFALAISVAHYLPQIYSPNIYKPFNFMTILLLSNTFYHRKRMTANYKRITVFLQVFTSFAIPITTRREGWLYWIIALICIEKLSITSHLR